MGRFGGKQSTTIRARVRLLVVACIVPAWLLAVAITYFSYERERNNIVTATVQTARSLTQGLERELSMSLAVLQTLATSTRIDERDYRRFHARAAQVLKQSQADNIVLFDTEQQSLMLAASPFGTPLPKIQRDRLPSVVATGKPAVSDYFVGELTNRPQIIVAVPVLRDGKVLGRLDMLFSTERFTQLLEDQSFAHGWTAAVMDSKGVIVARNRNASKFIGTMASANLWRQLQQRSEGSFSGRTSDGIDVIACFSRSDVYGWTVIIGVPKAMFAAELKRRLVLYALGGLVMLILGLILANMIGRSITDPIRALVAPALSIGRGETAVIAPSSLREARGLGTALTDAQTLLRQREQAREQAEALLHDSQSRLRMALEVSQIGDWDLDLKTGVVNHSMRHDQCFGYTEPLTEWNVETFFSRLHPDERDSARAYVDERLRLGESWQREYRVIWPDGSTHWIATHGTILAENGVPYFIVGLISDITDRKQREELRLHSVRLAAENRQIQESNRVKSEFLANMSHELRTPLNAIIGFADILRANLVSLSEEKRQTYLGHVASSGRHLLQLINDVLDLSKVESGKFEFFPESVDLPRLVQDVMGVLHAEAARKSITLLTEHQAGLGDMVLDPSRLKQMLYNFLSNAIKFTDIGGRVVLRSSLQGPEQLRIEVEDTGIGIAPSDQRKLFNQFQQIQSGAAKSHQGTGLGLALTKRLAELQGGSVGVRSELGVGSVFFLVLPCCARPASAMLPAQKVMPPGAPSVLVIEDDVANQIKVSARVLVVDDDPASLDLMAAALHAIGMTALCVQDGAAALTSIETQLPDAIVLDLLMPDMNGFDVLHALLKRHDLVHLPVFVWTSMALSTDEVAILERTAQGVVAKSHGSMDALAEHIQAWCLARPIALDKGETLS